MVIDPPNGSLKIGNRLINKQIEIVRDKSVKYFTFFIYNIPFVVII